MSRLQERHAKRPLQPTVTRKVVCRDVFVCACVCRRPTTANTTTLTTFTTTTTTSTFIPTLHRHLFHPPPRTLLLTICILPLSWIIQATIRPLFTPLLLAAEVQLALKQNIFRPSPRSYTASPPRRHLPLPLLPRTRLHFRNIFTCEGKERLRFRFLGKEKKKEVLKSIENTLYIKV